MDNETNKIIYTEHIKSLRSLDVENNNKVIICFSGVPKSGKTTIAKKIEKEYKGVRVSNDQIREVIQKKIKCREEEIQELLETYLFWFIENLKNFSNKLIILDSSIDRKYKKVFKIAGEIDYKLFIIRLELSKEKFKERIRDKTGNKSHFESMDKWFQENDDFSREVMSNFVIDSNKKPDIGKLFNNINKNFIRSINNEAAS